MTIQRLPGSAITPGTITVTQLDSATATVIQTGGGPKITNIQVTDAAYTVIDDTAVDTAGGNIRITGTGFVTGCSVIVGSQPANSVAFVSSTEVRVQVGAQSAGTYIVYLVNPDGGVGIRVNGLTYSANPAWQTASALPEQYDNVAISLSLVATEATSYTITSGSLPPGLSLNANTGVITGTVTGITVDTLYTFTVRATDAQLQDSPRTFTVTITVSDPYFRLTSLLLSGSALSANSVIRDSSTNNFNLTMIGDSRASNFTPYGSGWSNLFNSNRLNIATTGFAPGTGNFTVEAWIYPTSYNSSSAVFTVTTTGGLWLGKNGSNWVLRAYAVADQLTTTLPTLNTWTHVAWVRSGSTATIYFNGNSVVSGTVTYNFVSGSLAIGDDGGGTSYFLGYVSNLRYTTTAAYTANFTPATTNLTALAGTQLLTCQDNRFRDTSANAYTITTTGTPTVSSFNPFNITNTGVNGSIYLDGTGDYVTTPTSQAPLALDTANFTVECWVYFSSGQPQTNPCILSSSVGSSLANTILLQFGTQPSTQIALWVNNVHLTASATNNNLVFNAWNHIAVCRTGGSTYSFFINGIAVNSVASNSTSLTANDWRLGYWFSGAHALLGYIADFRIIKGTALYSGNFTPPTAPLTAVTNTQLLTCQYDQPHNNHTFLDSSSNQFLITRNGNASQGTFSPFSQTGWSLLFTRSNNTDRVLVSSNAGLGLQSNNFTVELWAYFNSAFTGDGPFCVNIPSGGFAANTWWFGPHSVNSGRVTVYIYNFSSSGPFIAEATSPPVNQWVHYALVRSSNTFTIYRNGVSTATGTFSGAVSSSTSLLYIGRSGDAGATAAGFDGYISNLRIVNGVAVYTGTFTPPTVPLTITQSTGANIAAITGTQTGLLCLQSNRLLDNSTFAASLSMDAGSPKIQAFSPFAATAVYNPVIHGGSAYFDGSGDYLEMTYNPAFKFAASQDFCVEFWAYATSSLTTNYILSQVTTNNWGFIFGVGAVTSGRISVYYGNGATNSVQYLDDTAAFPLYQWIHVAWCRTSGTMSLFVDGTRRSTVANTNAINLTTDRGIRIGAHQDGAASVFWPGYIASLRSIVGNSPYNATLTTLTLPTTPATSTANTSILLNFVDSAILDSTGRNALETLGDAKTSSVITKFTGGSMYFDGTGDYLAVPANFLHNQLYASNRSFTIEFWIYLQAYAGAGVAATVISTYGGGGGADGWRIETSPNAPANAIRWVSNGSDTACSATIELNTWIHYAFTYNGTTVKVFKNGVLGNTATTSWTNNTGRMFIGTANAGLAFPITGYLTDVRITNAERYTATFTAPTAPARLK